MSRPVVFVIGASGNIGRATMNALSTRFGDKLDIRAGVRNPDKAEQLKQLANIQVVKAEMGDEGLKDTFKGVETLFIIAPGTPNRVDLVIPTAEAAKAAGVKFILGVSGSSAGQPEIVLSRPFGQIEERVKALGVPCCFVRLPYFTDNFAMLKQSIVGQSAIYEPCKPDTPMGCIVAADAGKAAAVILSNPDKHAGKTYHLVSHVVTHQEVAKAFSEALGKEVKFVQMEYEAGRELFKQFGGDWVADGLIEMFKALDSGIIPVPTCDDIPEITGEQPTKLKDFVKVVAASF